MKNFKEITLTMTHNRVFSHWIELYKGDTITIRYDDLEAERETRENWSCSYRCTLSHNRKQGYEGVNVSGSHTLLLNMFECVESNRNVIEATAKSDLELLTKIVKDSTFEYHNIYV